MSSRARPAAADDAESRKTIKLSEGCHSTSIADRDQPDQPSTPISLLGLTVQCFIDENAARALASGAPHIQIKSLGEKKKYLVPRETVIEALKGEIDYLE